jgi:hypothetical protein
LEIQAILMTPDPPSYDISGGKAHDGEMASKKEEAAGAAWEGADLERPLTGEEPDSDSLAVARRWIGVYHHLVSLEQELLDVLARMIPSMPNEAQQEAERTNLPVLASQVERFRHRLEYWRARREEIEGKTEQLPEGHPE